MLGFVPLSSAPISSLEDDDTFLLLEFSLPIGISPFYTIETTKTLCWVLDCKNSCSIWQIDSCPSAC